LSIFLQAFSYLNFVLLAESFFFSLFFASFFTFYFLLFTFLINIYIIILNPRPEIFFIVSFPIFLRNLFSKFFKAESLASYISSHILIFNSSCGTTLLLYFIK